ncbi:MAG: flagellar cap protein FliD N-terminal domain-containing protein, partial [Opitutaceae bacterium]
MAGIQLSGLGSGFDWQAVVDKLMEVEATPKTRMQSEQTTNSTKSSALSALDTYLSAVQTSVNALNTPSLYTKRTATSSVSNSTWSASAANGTITSSYKIAVTELATAAVWNGGSDIGKPLDSTGTYPTASVSTLMSSLPTGIPVTAGTFTINGSRIDVALTDSLDTVLTNINTATSGAVTATYNNTTDKIELRSTVPSAPIVLGSGNDSSNFLQAMRLANNGTDSIDSASMLGTTTAS